MRDFLTARILSLQSANADGDISAEASAFMAVGSLLAVKWSGPRDKITDKGNRRNASDPNNGSISRVLLGRDDFTHFRRLTDGRTERRTDGQNDSETRGRI